MLASRASQRILLVILIALAAAIGVVLLTATHGARAPAVVGGTALQGPLLPAGLRAADFTLADQDGRPVRLSHYRGHVVVVTFIHSLCHDTCPFMVEQIKGALDDLAGAGRGVAAIAVSVNPREDTRTNRRAFLAKHRMTGRMGFLNGSQDAVARVWHAYAMQPVQDKSLAHTSFVLLIDRAGIERVGFPADQLTPEALAHDIGVLQRERA
jgi:protein SCO1/2